MGRGGVNEEPKPLSYLKGALRYLKGGFEGFEGILGLRRLRRYLKGASKPYLKGASTKVP